MIHEPTTSRKGRADENHDTRHAERGPSARREPRFDGAFRPVDVPFDLRRLGDDGPLTGDVPAAADAAVSHAIETLGLPAGHPPIGPLLSVPLLAGEVLLGELAVGNDPRSRRFAQLPRCTLGSPDVDRSGGLPHLGFWPTAVS